MSLSNRLQNPAKPFPGRSLRRAADRRFRLTVVTYSDGRSSISATLELGPAEGREIEPTEGIGSSASGRPTTSPGAVRSLNSAAISGVGAAVPGPGIRQRVRRRPAGSLAAPHVSALRREVR